MKLSKGEVLFLSLIIFCSIYFFLPLGHTEALMHKLPIEHLSEEKEVEEHGSVSVASLTWDLYQLALTEGITPTEWISYWRGSITSQEEKRVRAWLEKENFVLINQHIQSPHHGILISEEIWKLELNGTVHQVQIFNPQNSKRSSNFIYTWSGNEMDYQWVKAYEEREQQIFNQLEQKPQTFTCIEGFINDTLNFGLLKDYKFEHWIADIYEGELNHRVSDSNFVSVNGYIPTWGKYFFSAGDKKNNLQLSARYNALEDQTRVTIGYPLILKEH
jgi:hypothetical protein